MFVIGMNDSPDELPPIRRVWCGSTPRNVNRPCIVRQWTKPVWYLRPAARIP